MRWIRTFFFLTLLLGGTSCQTNNTLPAVSTLESLQPGEKLGDFSAASVVVDHRGRPFAATFKHDRFDFGLHVLLFETAPQAAMWFKTPPTSDKGEAHALEHVVLGKGKSGKYLSLLYDMELGGDSAATYSDFTFYHFYSQAGVESFFKLFRQNIKMLLEPEFSDEDVRREVFHYGVDRDGRSGALKLVEKGTVYNEMNGSHGYWDNWYGMLENIYGPDHYSRFRSGGSPEGLRRTTPHDVRLFHQRNYRLTEGFGAILVAPPATDLREYLIEVSRIFTDLATGLPDWQKEAPEREEQKISARKSKTPRIYPYAGANAADPASLTFAWPSFEPVNYTDLFRLGLFLSEFAKGSDSYLHKKMINSATRDRDFHLDSVWMGVNREFSQPFIYGSFSGLPVNRLNEREMDALRAKVVRELKNVADWKDGSAPLLEFNRKVKASLESFIRHQKSLLDKPPGFGFRGTGDDWKETLADLELKEGFRKSFVEVKEKEFFLAELSSGKNVWKKVVEDFSLTDTPYINAKKVSPSMLSEIEKRQEERIAGEEKRLLKKYGTSDLQTALAKFKEDYDRTTAEIAAGSELENKPKFTATPPMSYDPDIKHRKATLWGSVPLTVSEFANTPKMSFGLANSLKVFSSDEYIYLPLMRRLIDEVGLREGNKVTPYDEMYEEMRRKILGVSFGYNTYQFEDRENIYEFEVTLAALTIPEMRDSLEFWRRILKANDLNEENLPRIRDLVDRSLSSLVKARQGRAEDWLSGLAGSYFEQQDTLPFYTGVSASLLHTYYRYRWWLRDAPDSSQLIAAKDFALRIEGLLGRSVDLEDFAKKLATWKLKAPQKTMQEELLARVFELSPNFKEEIRYLTQLMIQDWRVTPKSVLAKLRGMQNRLLHRRGMSGYLVGTPENVRKALDELKNWSDLFPDEKPPVHEEPKIRTVNDNIRRRVPGADFGFPRYLGFVYPDSVNGHIVATAHGMRYDKADENELLEGLSLQLISGGAPHALFMKTWQEGLAYSNGISGNEYRGRLRYYAERSPNLPALLEFASKTVADQSQLQDDYLNEYALAQFFAGSRLLNSPASRGYAVYEEQKTGNTSKKTERFREKLLELRRKKNLRQELLKRLPQVAHRLTAGSQYYPLQKKYESEFFFVGPEKQLSSVDRLLGDRQLIRVYPSDFWIRGDHGAGSGNEEMRSKE